MYIASAFFSNSNSILKAIENGCTVFLIVRLNQGTNPNSLNQILGKRNVYIRYFTSESFHPKLYIAENSAAIIGSSNLTRAGLGSNQEVNVEFDYEEEGFERLHDIFAGYWNEAKVLDQPTLDIFTKIIADRTGHNVNPSQFIFEVLGENRFSNIDSDTKDSKEGSFIAAFKRNYQLYIAAFRKLTDIYSQVSPERRWMDIPLRIEVDRFLWWVREFHCAGESYKGVARRGHDKIMPLVKSLKDEFLQAKNDYLDTVATNYRYVSGILANSQAIMTLPQDQLYPALLYIHAFNDRFRFFAGGHPEMKRQFLAENPEAKIKKTISFLLYGKGSYEERIYSVIHSSNYKLTNFSESCAKELFGMINVEEVPICNGRTLKSMEWLGFGAL